MGEGSANPTNPHHTFTIIQPNTQLQKIQKPRKPKRKDTQVPQPSDPNDNVADEAVYKELGDSLVRAATTEAEQDSGNITKTRSKATPNESSSLGMTSGGGHRGNTLQSDKDRLKLNELMKLCTTLQKKVLDLEKTKTTQGNEIASLKRRFKKLKKKRRSRTYKLKRLYKVGLTARVESSGDEEDLGEDASKQGKRINTIDVDEDITLVNVQDDADNVMFDVNLELLDEKLSQEDVNQKLLRNLSPKWNTHAVVWRNKAELDTMSMDDLNNNLKVYEPEVKGVSSSSSSTKNMAFVSSSNNNTSSSNEVVNAAHGVTTASTQLNTAYSTNIENLNDVVICSFFASQPNSP
ncbi:hypothetical protein Tco_0764471 [Tanacetum coccineum]